MADQMNSTRGASRPPDDLRPDSAMGGASDTDSGGGNATGNPDADTGMLAGDSVSRGDPLRDREKLFPDTSNQPNRSINEKSNDVTNADEEKGGAKRR